MEDLGQEFGELRVRLFTVKIAGNEVEGSALIKESIG